LIDWVTLFDAAYPVAGASPTDLQRLAAGVGQRLPSSYLSLLAWSNGGEFRMGGRWFQFFPAVDPVHGVLAISEAYGIPRYMPGALPFALNGGGTFYLLDMRETAVAGEYPVVCSHSGNLGWAPDECVRIADSFPEACRGTIDVDELRTSL
jgi:SMI1 / KNR4 family (SUKH-1)